MVEALQKGATPPMNYDQYFPFVTAPLDTIGATATALSEEAVDYSEAKADDALRALILYAVLLAGSLILRGGRLPHCASPCGGPGPAHHRRHGSHFRRRSHHRHPL